MDTQTFINDLNEFSSQYKVWWYEPYNIFHENYLKEHPNFSKSKEGMLAYIKALGELEAKLRQEKDLIKKFYNFLDQNYEVYSNGSVEQCAEIRATVNQCYYLDTRDGIHRFLENLLLRHAERVTKEINLSGDRKWLLRGLVAMSMENSGVDFRDTLIHLADLYIAAEHKITIPGQDFKKTAKISSHEKPRGGETPVSEMMENTPSSEIIRARKSMK
jgi:hypothetical protein